MLEQMLTPTVSRLVEFWPWLSDYRWQLGATLLVALVCVLTVLFNMVMSRLISYLSHKGSQLDGQLLKAARSPLRAMIWVLGLSLLLEILDRNELAATGAIGDEVRRFGTILILAWAGLRLIKVIEDWVIGATGSRQRMDRTSADAIAKLMRLILFVLVGLTLLQSAGVSISGILAFGGVGGIAVGFAARDLLANFFGGLMIYMDRPFRVGDWVRSPDKEIEGTVEHIGWRLTRIRTFDQRPLYVPNATFINIAVENPSRMFNRRIFEHVGVRYDDVSRVQQIANEIREMLSSHDEIDTRQTLIVHLNRFGPSSLDIMVYTFTKTTQWVRYHEIKQDVMLKIAQIIECNGAEFAFPTQTVHLAGTESEEPAFAGFPPAGEGQLRK